LAFSAALGCAMQLPANLVVEATHFTKATHTVFVRTAQLPVAPKLQLRWSILAC
jgi:hypothetical protein